jgi:AraC family transcriptional regulator
MLSPVCRCLSVMHTSRTALFRSTLAVVERVECQTPFASPREDYSPEFQVAFPYRGAFVWHVGTDAVVSDPNQVLFVRGGESFRIRHAQREGFGEMVITPAPDLMRDVAATTGFDLERHPLFDVRGCRVPPALQLSCALFLHQGRSERCCSMAAGEMLVRLLTDALRLSVPAVVQAPNTKRLIRRAKEFLLANYRQSVQLTDVASAAGASPAYLTDVFRRFEGVPLHGYLTQLRLAAALLELPHTDDLTALALNLGFSSHSHFTFAFRRSFGCTPSEFRRLTRRRRAALEPARRLA